MVHAKITNQFQPTTVKSASIAFRHLTHDNIGTRNFERVLENVTIVSYGSLFLVYGLIIHPSQILDRNAFAFLITDALIT